MGSYSFDVDDLGRAGYFLELLHLLRSSDYSDSYICRRFQLARPEEFEIDRKKRAPLQAVESPADILVTLFLAGDMVSHSDAIRLLGSSNVALLERMALMKPGVTSDCFYGTVALYPVEDIYIASDRWSTPDGSPLPGPDDTVYPAFIPNTRLFLRHLPVRPGGIVLDLCAGTGAAAIQAASRGARQAWSGDIAGRSSRFAEFNCRLNGISNVRVVTSDLYQNLEGTRFDVISAHPPYVPTLQPKWIFFSGGQDGEEVTRRIVEGLPDHLNNGGNFIALTMGGDHTGRPFEYRVREWLGSRHGEFDIAFIVRKELNPQEFALRANRQTIRTREESDLWSQFFKEHQVESLVYGFLCIQRRAEAGRSFTVRRQASPTLSRAPWEWLLRWEAAAHSEKLQNLILGSALHAGQATEFEVLHHLTQGLWNPSAYKLRTEHPFSTECEAQPWMAHLISLCDGRSTGRDVLKALIENEVLPSSIKESEFAEAAASLVSGGFIEVEGYGAHPD